jgi:hypothetical protein
MILHSSMLFLLVCRSAAITQTERLATEALLSPAMMNTAFARAAGTTEKQTCVQETMAALGSTGTVATFPALTLA